MATGIVIVKEWERMVLLRWGQHVGNKSRGFHFLIPVIYNGSIVDTRELPQRVPTQKYITRDNVVIDMDFVLYYRVLPDQAEKAVIGVQPNHHVAVQSLAVGELRAIIGNLTLADALSEREQIQNQLQIALDENTGRWGVKVQGVAINEIDPPPGVKSAMEREKSAAAIKTADITESEGQRQAEINRAEGEKQAAILKAEGSKQSEILNAEGDQQAAVLRADGFATALEKIHGVAQKIDANTLSLQYFETLKELGSSAATKFIFPMEFTSLLSPFTKMAGRGDGGGGGDSEGKGG